MAIHFPNGAVIVFQIHRTRIFVIIELVNTVQRLGNGCVSKNFAII